MERELMHTMNKKVLQLFCHKSFGKRSVQKKASHMFAQHPELSQLQGKKELMKL